MPELKKHCRLYVKQQKNSASPERKHLITIVNLIQINVQQCTTTVL